MIVFLCNLLSNNISELVNDKLYIGYAALLLLDSISNLIRTLSYISVSVKVNVNIVLPKITRLLLVIARYQQIWY